MTISVPTIDSNFVVDPATINTLKSVTKTKGLRNILVTGPTGCGKTELAAHLAATLHRPMYVACVSQCVEPLDLIGAKGVANGATFFKESAFVKAIEQDMSIVVLDEINRASASILNLLIPLLDHRGSFYVEELDREVKVGKGVVFVATANLGSEFAGTYKLDEALISRFPFRYEADFLSMEDEATMLEKKTGVTTETAKVLAKLAADLRSKATGFGSTLDRSLSTRQVIATAELIATGVSTMEAINVCVLPLYDSDGNSSNSQRAQASATVQFIIGEVD